MSWKEILSLIDDHYKVNSFLVESNALFDVNFILPKFMHSCMIRYEEGASITRGGEEQLDKKLDMELDMELDMKTSHGRAREEREACAREEDKRERKSRA